jgi:hypothetical protein
MPGTIDLSTTIRNAMSAVLPHGVRVEIKQGTPKAVPTFDLFIHAGSGLHHFLAGWAGEGWPADVERLVAAAPKIEIVFGKQLSRGAKDWLSTHRRGWVDESGDANVFLKTGLVIVRQGQIHRKDAESHVRWTQTMVAAAEAVLAGVPPTVESVEQATGISRGASNNALASLEKLDLLERPKSERGPQSARRVIDPDVFLDQYASAAASLRRKKPIIKLHRLWKDPLESFQFEIGPALSNNLTTWAITGAAASVLIAPYLSDFTVVELYVDDDLFSNRDRLEEIVGGRVVDRGHLIEVRTLPTRISAEGPIVHGIHVALLARVYADLLAVGGRSAEAARFMREQVSVGLRS